MRAYTRGFEPRGSPDTGAHVCLVAWICIDRLRLATRTRRVSRSVHHAQSRGLSVGFCWVSTGGAPPPPPAQTAPLPLRSRLSTWGSGGTRTRTGDTMIFSHVRYIAGRFWWFQNPLIQAYFSHPTLLGVSGCCSGLLSNYCQIQCQYTTLGSGNSP